MSASLTAIMPYLSAVKIAEHQWGFVLKATAPEVTPSVSVPTISTDQIVSSLETAIIADLKKVGLKALETFIVSKIPKFAASFIGKLLLGAANPLVGFLLNIAITAMVKLTDYFAYYLDKTIYNNAQAADVANAALANQQAQASGTAAQKAAAQQALINAAKNLINMNK